MKQSVFLALTTLFILATGSAAQAQYVSTGFSQNPEQDPQWETYSSLGIIGLRANEYIYDGNWTTSHLIWESVAPIVSAGGRVRLDGGWRLNMGIDAATIGTSYMEDYDWLKTFGHTNAKDDWTHRSQHEKTDLDHFIRGDIFFGYDTMAKEATSFTLGAGLKYTDVQWSAYGGDLVYSDIAFRDTSYSIADSIKGITYRQTIPAFYLGLEFETTQDEWSFAASAHVGAALLAKDDDDHWLRTLNFIGELQPSVIFAVKGSVAYALDATTKIFASFGYDKMYTARGHLTEKNTVTNAVRQFSDTAGADIESLTLSVGMSTTF